MCECVFFYTCTYGRVCLYIRKYFFFFFIYINPTARFFLIWQMSLALAEDSPDGEKIIINTRTRSRSAGAYKNTKIADSFPNVDYYYCVVHAVNIACECKWISRTYIFQIVVIRHPSFIHVPVRLVGTCAGSITHECQPAVSRDPRFPETRVLEANFVSHVLNAPQAVLSDFYYIFWKRDGKKKSKVFVGFFNICFCPDKKRDFRYLGHFGSEDGNPADSLNSSLLIVFY